MSSSLQHGTTVGQPSLQASRQELILFLGQVCLYLGLTTIKVLEAQCPGNTSKYSFCMEIISDLRRTPGRVLSLLLEFRQKILFGNSSLPGKGFWLYMIAFQFDSIRQTVNSSLIF